MLFDCYQYTLSEISPQISTYFKSNKTTTRKESPRLCTVTYIVTSNGETARDEKASISYLIEIIDTWNDSGKKW